MAKSKTLNTEVPIKKKVVVDTKNINNTMESIKTRDLPKDFEESLIKEEEPKPTEPEKPQETPKETKEVATEVKTQEVKEQSSLAKKQNQSADLGNISPLCVIIAILILILAALYMF